MKEIRSNEFEDEKSISVVDLLLYVFHRWKRMAIVAVFLAFLMILGGVFNSYKGYRSLKNDSQISPIQLTKEEMQSFYEKSMSMSVYEDIVKAYQIYLEESILCRLDPNGFYKGSLNYLLSLESEEEYIGAEAICESEILDTESYEQVAKAMGEDAAVSKIEEVIELSTERVASENNLLMRISVTAMCDTEEGCQKMLDSLAKVVEAADFSGIRGSIGHAQKLSEKIVFTSDSALIVKKQEIINAKNAADTELTTLKNSLTEDQKIYREWLEAEDTDVSEPEFELSVNWKYVIIAALAGAFSVAGLYACIYLFDGRIHSKEELESQVKVPVFGMVGDGSKENAPEMIVTLLAGHLGTPGLNQVYLSGSLGKQQSQVMDVLKRLLEKKGISAQVGESILADEDSLQQAVDCGYIIFVEKYNESREKNVIEAIAKAGFCGINVLGVILEK